MFGRSCGNPFKHADCANVLINIGPMHSLAIAYDLKILALFGSSIG